MDFEFSPDELAFRTEIRDFLAQEWPAPTTQGLLSFNNETVEAEAEARFRRRLGEAGWLSRWWPREFGGRAPSGVESFIFGWELSAHAAPFPFFAVNVVSRLLMRYGTADQRNDFLPRIGSGDCDFAIGFTEPNSGSDLASLQTRAVREGDHYVIRGQKLFTSQAERREYIWLAARTDPDAPKHRGISLFIVPTTSPGLSIRPLEVIGNGRTNITFYDDVVLPLEARVGDENSGWRYIRESLDLDRSVGIQYGYIPPLFAALEAHVEGRAPASDAWAAPHRLQLEALRPQVRALELMCMEIGSLLAKGVIPHLESSALKIYGTELRERLATAWVDALAADPGTGAGDTTEDLELAVQRFYLGSRRPIITGGTNEIQRTIIAATLGLPRGA